MTINNAIRNFLKEEDGATMIEYALLAALVAVAAMVGMRTLGTALNESFAEIARKLKIT